MPSMIDRSFACQVMLRQLRQVCAQNFVQQPLCLKKEAFSTRDSTLYVYCMQYIDIVVYENTGFNSRADFSFDCNDNGTLN